MVIHVMQHVADKETIEDIREIGLIVNDPTDRWKGDRGNPPGVYLTKGLDSPYVEWYKHCVARCNKFKKGEILTINVAGLPVALDPGSTICANSDCLKQEKDCKCEEYNPWEYRGEAFFSPVDIDPERIL